MSRPMHIDFVSDVVCPWCVIGLRGLERALVNVGDLVEAEIVFHPFELNPDMPAAGEDVGEHIARKYGATPEQSAANRNGIRARAADLGFAMAMKPGSRIYNSFDAHRLLAWAGEQGRQRDLKHALFAAYFTDGLDIGDVGVLATAVQTAGLDPVEARAILASDRYAAQVRAEEETWRREGIDSVPAVIVNRKYMISGGQPPEAFERALRAIAADAA